MFTKYRIYSYSFRGNCSFLNLENQRSQYINVRKVFKGGNYSRVETIWGNMVTLWQFQKVCLQTTWDFQLKFSHSDLHELFKIFFFKCGLISENCPLWLKSFKTVLSLKKRSSRYFLEHFFRDLNQNEQLSEIKPTSVNYYHRCAHCAMIFTMQNGVWRRRF